ncbi:pyocin knob domain-containing protein [Lactobacillus crispatus]|uniref:pyocin knob domain-containing protein n=1 Tax=Lactobacillus crispatus TaxID=47770 RepID=UPI0011D27CCC|nr:pyocin knob domain-containing protein [Lactobacillus crispatus]
MSTIRDPAYITNAGRTMMTAGGEVTYTKAVLYAQDISGLSDSQIKALTSLGNPLREVKIGVSDKQSTYSGSTVILEAVFQNSNLKADLEYKAVGFFARKNDVEQLVIVAVANQGAYLAATNPDGVATDALDLKIAVKIGDATSVTAVIDPAGSVTPASLNSAIKQATQELTAKIDTKSNSQDVQNALNQKADKSTVEDSLATKANATDLNKLSSELAKKAESSDLANLVTEVNKKANSDDVTAQISDVNKSINAVSDTVTKNKDAIDKQIASLTTTVNAKVDASYSYSREELDKKFLALSVSADGKMSAEQVTSMIATKADKSYVDEKLDEKADKSSVDAKINAIDFSKIKFCKQYVTSDNKMAGGTWQATKNADGTYTIDLWHDDWTAAKLADVLAQLPNKVDTSTVNAQIADVKDTAQSNLDKVKSDLNGAINTKANSDDVYNKPAIDSAFNTRDNNINRAQSTADGAQTTANNALPKAGGNMNLRSTINWSGGGINDRTGNLGGLYWSGGSDTASIYGNQNANDNLDLVFDLGDDGSNHFSFRNKGGEVAAIRSNGHYTGTIDWDNIWGRPDVATHADVNNAVNPIRYAPQERRSLDANDDANNIVDDGVYRISGSPIKNGNGKSWCFLRVKRWDYNTIYQELDCGSNGIFVRNISQTNKNYPGWQRIATSDDISNLQNIINQQNQTIQSLTMRLNNAENEINYIKANYVEGKRFPASQEAQANSWENANPQRLAFITK